MGGGGYKYSITRGYIGSSLCKLSFNLSGSSVYHVVPIHLNSDYIVYIKDISAVFTKDVYYILRSYGANREIMLVDYGDSPICEESCTREECDYYLSLIPESWIVNISSSIYKTTYMYKLPIR